MTQQVIGIGTVPNDGTGDPIRTAAQKINANFGELYATLYVVPVGVPLTIGAVTVQVGAGSPEGVVTAPVGAFWIQTDGTSGNVWWAKESGTGNTGWKLRPNATAPTFTGNVALAQFNAGNSGAALTIDFNSGNNQRVTLTNTTTLTLSNGKAGGVYTLELVQDGTGSRLVTWAASGASVLWPGGTAPTLTTTINRADIVTFYYDAVPGTPRYCGQTFGLNYAV